MWKLYMVYMYRDALCSPKDKVNSRVVVDREGGNLPAEWYKQYMPHEPGQAPAAVKMLDVCLYACCPWDISCLPHCLPSQAEINVE